MKEKTIKTIKGCCIAAVVLMAIVFLFNTFFWIEFWRTAEWKDEIINWQRTMLIGDIGTYVLLTCSVIIFISNVLRGLTEGMIFNRCNTYVIYAGAVLLFFNLFFSYTSQNAAEGIYVFAIDTEMLISPLLLVILGLLHKLAVEASEENNLTI